MKTYKNLNEFLIANGATSWSEYAKHLYKVTPCGPWVRRVTCERAAHIQKDTAYIMKQGKDAILRPGQKLTEEFKDFIGPMGPWATFSKQARDFAKNHPEELQVTRWERGIALTRDMQVPEKLVTHDDNLVAVPFPVIGFEIGSIVEGSDVEIGPKLLRFPLSSDDYDAAVKAINDEATFYWKRDNTDLYFITDGKGIDGTRATLRIVAFEKPKWGDPTDLKRVPPAIRKALLAFLTFVDKGTVGEENISFAPGWFVRRYIDTSTW
jgi:hypothetical protein